MRNHFGEYPIVNIISQYLILCITFKILKEFRYYLAFLLSFRIVLLLI